VQDMVMKSVPVDYLTRHINCELYFWFQIPSRAHLNVRFANIAFI
jgi:hypothetical protein